MNEPVTPRPAEIQPLITAEEIEAIGTEVGHGARVAARFGCGLMGMISAFVALVLLAVAIIVVMALRGVSHAVDEASSGFTRMPANPRVGLIRPQELSSITGSHGYIQLDVAAPPTGYGSFEAVKNLPWALTIAQAWQTDARLDRIDLKRLRGDGTSNVADDPDASVIYRFTSPSRMEEWNRQADLGKPVVLDELFLQIKSGQAKAVQFCSRPSRDETPPFPQSEPLERILEGMNASPKGVQKPFYDAYLYSSGNEGWVWHLSTLSGRDSLPRVRAVDAKAWPWR